MRSLTRVKRRRLGIAVSATVLVLAIALFSFQSLRAGETYRTDIGVFRRITLPDRSVIDLNTDTVARVRFTEKQREIELVQGEAYFRVVSDAARPFVVRAGDTTARSLGTAFGVRLYSSSKAAVLVTEGRVLLSTPARGLGFGAEDQESVIAAGERAVDSAGRVTIFTLSPEEVESRHAWRHGMFIFRDQPLSEVVAELNRYNKLQIIVRDPAVADMRFNGQLGTRGVDTLISVLGRAHGLVGTSVPGRADVIELRKASGR